MSMLRIFLTGLMLNLAAVQAQAQGTEVAFGGLQHDSSLPVEVTADQLNVDQAAGTAVFTGNVIAAQGDMRLSSKRLNVQYATENGQITGRISDMVATGDVVFVNGTEAAEGERAVYSVEKGTVVITENVLLTQGQNAMSGDRLDINLETGTGIIQGRVKTIFQPSASQ